MRRSITFVAALSVLLAVTLTYTNHFHNAFQFDDFHSITDNVFIRDLANVPKFFTDARTSSVYPTHQAWRPLVTASLAFDYWLAKGYNTFYFHLSTFLWFLTLLVLAAWLFRTVLDKIDPHPRNFWIAWFAAAWFGLHPAIAETVNYIIQRADLMSTWGVVAGLAIYAALPKWRQWGIYLLPVAIGFLCKPPAMIFPALLALYIFLFEEDASRGNWPRVFRRTLPSLALTMAFLALEAAMTPKSFSPGSVSAWRYLITQPYVWFRYFVSFFLPFHLSADSDLSALNSVVSLEALGGLLFVAALIFAIVIFSKQPATQPVAFGLGWFALGLIPTSVFPLAEVENDHRMFLPFVGLVLAGAWTGASLLRNRRREFQSALAAGGICVLLLYAMGTRRRNEVWRTQDSLWEDVTLKSPRNGRGLMNYGLTRMAVGDYRTALNYFERALRYTPNYPSLEINLGIDSGALGRDAEAEAHFRRAIALSPNDFEPHYYYGRWLRGKGRNDQAIGELRTAIGLNHADINSRHLLLATYADQGDWAQLKPLAMETLQLAPNDPEVRRYASMQPQPRQPAPPAAARSVDSMINLSLQAYQKGDFEGCIRAAKMALKLRNDSAEAWNNIIAANNALHRWDEAIRAGHEALRIRPDYALAQNNLRWAESQKALQAAQAR
jgi:tetratricopeptide (TPR) repeat protein